jgi:hypothetical protein
MSETQYSNILTKGVESSLPGTYTDGKLRVTIDQCNMYLDLQSTRIKITDVVSTLTEAQIKQLSSPLASKLYIASNTGKAFVYRNSEWVNVGECNLTQDTTTNSDLVIWFSGTDNTQPKYNTGVTFNPSTGVFKVANAECTTLKVNGMTVTVTENPDHSHKTVFSF